MPQGMVMDMVRRDLESESNLRGRGNPEARRCLSGGKSLKGEKSPPFIFPGCPYGPYLFNDVLGNEVHFLLRNAELPGGRLPEIGGEVFSTVPAPLRG